MPLPDGLPHVHQFDAIGTGWHIETTRPLSDETIRRIASEVELFDHEFSRFRQDSVISRLAREGGGATFTRGVDVIFPFYDRLYDLTDGRVTPMIGGVLSDLGYDAHYTLKPGKRRPMQNYGTVLMHHGQLVEVSEPVVIDIGAAGKGYLVDRLAGLVRDDHESFVVDGSGDLSVRNAGQIIGLEHPFDTTQVIGQIKVDDAALCASATNRRSWGDGLHHIIDPTTATPVRGIAATWVLADSAMIADGLATALFFVEPAVLAGSFDFLYVVMRADGSVSYSRDDRIRIY